VNSIATSALLTAGLIGGSWMGLPKLTAQAPSGPCVIDGAEFPELMPEYVIWETHFRSLVAAAVGDNFEGKQPKLAGAFDPRVIRNLAKDNGLSEHDMGSALVIAQKAILKFDAADSLALPPNPAPLELRARRAAAVDIILDARDEIIRTLPASASRALRRSAPAKGSKLYFPVTR
jgi:hypothetical protein